MAITCKLKEKYVARLDELISGAEAIPMRQHSRRTRCNMISGESGYSRKRGQRKNPAKASFSTLTDEQKVLLDALDLSRYLTR